MSSTSYSSSSQSRPLTILQKYWGYSDFRPNQLDIINSILSYRDTLAILPTGGGKSICFQVPGLCLPGLTLVVSPLISLMKDQVDQLKQRAISAIYLDSTFTVEQTKQVFIDLIARRYKFVYVSPERLLNHRFCRFCQTHSNLISLIAIDEAHCISLWGHDFRASFLRIKDFINNLPLRPHLAAFTATTTPTCTQDILRFLDFQKPQIFQQSFARDNLYLYHYHCPNPSIKKLKLLQLLQRHREQSGIIYCLTREAVTHLASWLNRLQIYPPHQSVLAYHGALPKDTRSQIQEKFITNQNPLIVATNAFGMGVDKANIRFVIHYQPSSNIENYYQEVGRAGRDGKRGDCYLLAHKSDWQINQQFINQLRLTSTDQTKTRRQILQKKLKAMQQFTQLKKHCHCRQNFILQYFQPELKNQTLTPCGRCDLCCSPTPSSQSTSAITSATSPVHHLRFLQLICQKLAHQLHPRLQFEFIFPMHSLFYLAILQPTSLEQFTAIPCFGQAFLQNPQLLQPFIKYFQRHQLSKKGYNVDK